MLQKTQNEGNQCSLKCLSQSCNMQLVNKSLCFPPLNSEHEMVKLEASEAINIK